MLARSFTRQIKGYNGLLVREKRTPTDWKSIVQEVLAQILGSDAALALRFYLDPELSLGNETRCRAGLVWRQLLDVFFPNRTVRTGRQ